MCSTASHIYIYICIYIHNVCIIYIYIYAYYIYIGRPAGGLRGVLRGPRGRRAHLPDVLGRRPDTVDMFVCIICLCVYIYIYIYMYTNI